MDKRQALTALLQATDLLTLKQQNIIIDALASLPDEDIQAMGVFLKAYIEAEREELPERQAALEQMLAKMAAQL